MNTDTTIFFKYEIAENANDRNREESFVLYVEPNGDRKLSQDVVYFRLMDALTIKLTHYNGEYAVKLIAYHYDEYKESKTAFIYAVKIIINDNLFCTNYIKQLVNDFLDNKMNELKMDNHPSTIATTGNVKLQWNGQKNALIDLFRQLKNIANEHNEPLIANSYDDIATFIMNNFTNFEGTKRGTILTQLKTASLVKKTEKKVIIECKSTKSDNS